MKTKKFLIFIIVIILFFSIVTNNNLYAQDFLICSKCGQKNEIVNKFCFICGDSLDDEYKAWLTKRNKTRYKEEKFISGRVDPPRLFTIPTARVLGTKDISLMGGGAFGVAVHQSFLGTIGMGLGNIAEVEFSTVGLINNISQGSPTVSTSAFKIQLIPEDLFGLSFFPTLAVSIRSSADWKDVRSDWRALNSNKAFYDYNEITQRVECAVSSIGYNTRFTIMYGVVTFPLGPVKIHSGLMLTDIRVKDMAVDYIWQEDNDAPEERQKNLIGGFAGFEIEYNPQTKLMVEIKTDSKHEYNMETKEIEVSHTYVAIGGVRFFFTKWLSIDTGVLYQT
ncbi:MAG: zinc ribbon domain-containing protein, partial [Candidatus Marinimicrobia bacterium]|nr:zinc ribbon domain-containing protein [Candidatus Neomarinimicrobiota bacterium]